MPNGKWVSCDNFYLLGRIQKKYKASITLQSISHHWINNQQYNDYLPFNHPSILRGLQHDPKKCLSTIKLRDREISLSL